MKVLLVDDHVLIREAMRGMLKRLRRDAVVLEAASSTEAMQTIASNPDVGLVLLDLSLPDRDGFSVLAELRERYPTVSVVVLSGVQDRANVLRALNLGALGFIPKSAHRDVMASALQLVFSGGIYIPPEILEREEPVEAESKPANEGKGRISPADLGLTDRQMDVLALVMQGKNNKTICRALDLAEPTVKNHVTAILKALKVSSRTEAVIAVNNLGWKFPNHP